MYMYYHCDCIWAVLEPRVSPAFGIVYFCNHCNRFDSIPAKTWTRGHWPLDDLWPKFVEVTCVTLPKDHCIWVAWKYIKVCGYICGYRDPFFKNLNQRSLTLRWPLAQVCWGHMCDSTQGSLCLSHMKIHQSMWIQRPFFQKLEPKVIDP